MYKDNVCQVMLEKKSSDKFLYTKLIKSIWMNMLSLHTEFYLKPFYSPFYYHHLDNNIIENVKIQVLKKYTLTYVGRYKRHKLNHETLFATFE